ncbi:hypothetical protein Lser_V15G07005 [Lactuca serriola]
MPYRPPLPYPIRAIPEEKAKEYKTFMEHVKALQVNIPFVETILQTPKYVNLRKGLFSARKDMVEVAEIVLNELPGKKGDPGSISIPCQFGNEIANQVLTDSGASINLIPYSFFKKLNLPEPKPISMKIHLADKTVIRPRGVCEDLLIKVDKFLLPVDFVVLDMEEDPKIPIILGRPFLNTTSALIDVCESTLTLRVGDESAVFKATQKTTRKEETMGFTEYSHTRRVALTDSTSPVEKPRHEDNLDLLLTSSFPMQIFPDSLEGLAEKGEIVKNYRDFQNIQVAYLDTMIQGDKEFRLDKEASLGEKENPRAWNDDANNSSIDSHTTNRKIKLVKPRARVFSNYELINLKKEKYKRWGQRMG